MKQERLRLDSFEIGGFKSIPHDHPIHFDMGGVNILIGANGSGKSNILSFFEMLFSMMKGSFQRYVAINGTSQTLLHYGPEYTSSINASLKFTNGRSFEEYTEYKFSLSAVAPQRLMISSEELVQTKCSTKDGYTTICRPLGANRLESSLVNANDPTEEMIRNWLTSCKGYNFCDTTLNAALRQASAADGAHYLYSDGSNLASFLYFLRNNYFEYYERIRDIVHLIVPQFYDFHLEPINGYVSLGWTDKTKNDYLFGVHQFSEGALRFIALATLLLQPEQTMPFVILLDSPELGLDLVAIEQLNKMMEDAASHAQIIVATQSPDLLDTFEVNYITVFDWNNTIHGTAINQPTFEEYAQWLDDHTLSELWYKNIFGGRPH